MKIQVGGLSDGCHDYRFHAEPSELGLSGAFSTGITVTATLEKSGNQLHLAAKVETAGSFTCDRCVAPFEKRLTPSCDMHYVTDATAGDRFDPSEVQVISPAYQVIDITDDVRQTLVLAVPLKLLCREDCAGLCPKCAKNLNEGRCECKDLIVEPRWEGLRRFLDG